MLSPQSQCLLRQKDLFSQGKWLLVNPVDAFIFRELPASVQGFHQYFDQYLAAKQSGSNFHHFGVTYSLEQDSAASDDGMKAKFDGIVLYLPKTKKHTIWLLKHLSGLLNKDGLLCIVGENKGGIKSCGKLLEAVGSAANKIESARHCSVYASVVSSPSPFDLGSELSWTDTSINQQQLSLASLPGVFSHGELDAGTRLLLENVNKVPGGRVLDFACGNGVIAQYVSQLNPGAQLFMSDINALALYCAQHSMQKATSPPQIIASNGLKQVEGQFNAIYSNPPFHTGIANDYSISQQFIADAAQKLNKGGELWLVANRFLPYAEHLHRHFGRFQRAAETTKFTLYRCIKT